MPSALGAALTRLAPPTADADLLARFTTSRDGEAFAELVRRHGPAVLAICRRVTGHWHDADDAFQAAFLVLARRAGQVRSGEPLGAWLYGVAVRVARKAAQRREWPGDVPDVPARAAEPFDPDSARAVVEEVGRLSPRYRAAVVLCELEGRPRAAAARELGIALGTLNSRLAAARKELAERLSARGFGPAALAALAPVVVPPELLAATAALPGHPAPAAVAALATGVHRAMLVRHLLAGVLVVGSVAALTAVLLAGPPTPAAPPTPAFAAVQPAAPKAAPRPAPKGPNKILIPKDGYLTLIDPDGKNEKRVCEHPVAVVPMTPARLSPDGKRVALLIEGQKHGDPLPSSRGQRRLHLYTLGEPGPARDTGLVADLFAWSPDGTKLAATGVPPFEGEAPPMSNFLIDVKTGEWTELSMPKHHVVTGWLADGDRIVTTSLVVTPRGVEYKLHLMDRDGTEHRQLTGENGLRGLGFPSPDGSRVLGHGYIPEADDGGKARQTRLELRLLDLPTDRQMMVEGIPPGGEVLGACWSPDGTRIAYTWRQLGDGTGREVESRLVIADPDGRNPRTVLSRRGRGVTLLGAPDWR
jgi:RNA polymerase sigma factor (sigma-70 family)